MTLEVGAEPTTNDSQLEHSFFVTASSFCDKTSRTDFFLQNGSVSEAFKRDSVILLQRRLTSSYQYDRLTPIRDINANIHHRTLDVRRPKTGFCT
jgi:hypothetical protein